MGKTVEQIYDGKLSEQFNEEIGERIFRIKTILNYYKENPKRLKYNLNVVDDVCNSFYTYDEETLTNYKIQIGNAEERHDKDGLYFIFTSNPNIRADARLINEHRNLRNLVERIRNEMNVIKEKLYKIRNRDLENSIFLLNQGEQK
jgi:hypothetical protein